LACGPVTPKRFGYKRHLLLQSCGATDDPPIAP